MMENGKSRKRRQLSPEEKWEDEGANFVVQPEDGQLERLVFTQAAPPQRRAATA